MSANEELSLDIGVDDILEAMREQGGYLDVSPDDALALYKIAYAHAARKLVRDPKVREIMTRRVVTVSPDDSALEAARTMAGARVSGLPAVSDGAVVGVVSIKDLLRLLALGPGSQTADLVALCLNPAFCQQIGDGPAGLAPVKTVMSAPALCVGPDTTRSRAARLMAERGVNRLPVVESGSLLGIVTRGDVARSIHDRTGGETA